MKKYLSILPMLVAACSTVTDDGGARNSASFYLLGDDQEEEEFAIAMYNTPSSENCINGYISTASNKNLQIKEFVSKRYYNVAYEIDDKIQIQGASVLKIGEESMVSSSPWIIVDGRQLFLPCAGKIVRIISIEPK